MAWAPDYVTLEEQKRYERIPVDDVQDDAELSIAIAAASRAIDKAAGRQFGHTEGEPQARYYTAEWNRRESRWEIPIDDVQDAAGLTVEVDRTGRGDYAAAVDPVVLWPRNAAADGKPWTRLVVPPGASAFPTAAADGVRVTAGKWGWDAVPAAVKQACLLQSSRFFARRLAPFGIAGSPDTGSEMRLLDRVDPDVAVSLRPVSRLWGAA